MKFAIIKSGGKQYRVSEKDRLNIEKIDGKADKKIIINQVLLIAEGDKIKIGKPLIKGAKVEVRLIDQLKGDKIKVFKFKPKKRYKRTKGHRQSYTAIEILKITG